MPVNAADCTAQIRLGRAFDSFAIIETMEQHAATGRKHVPAPLENIPIRINVDGVDVSGSVRWLVPNDITVAIDGSGRTRSSHVPYFMMALRRFHFATVDECGTRAVTGYGQQVAERLLRKLFEDS